MRILGVDPGSRITGFGVIEVDGPRLRVVDAGTVQLADLPMPERLKRLYSALSDIIHANSPDEFAIEKVFVQKNVESALKLGQARGVAICAAAMQGVAVHEYAPNQIKLAVVGRGHAAKEQMQHMVKILLRLNDLPSRDAADALACAVCHAHSRNSPMHAPLPRVRVV